ncbi:hypothetical protein [Chitinophaga polysaccharea]|uniref:hypothetical protein n=1 Tax=Chitinophaga polysaccharea TaxID=1293035 RepID=UPI001C8E4A56|nr:hypothetical protein [Chitinophaga polysaccharea]
MAFSDDKNPSSRKHIPLGKYIFWRKLNPPAVFPNIPSISGEINPKLLNYFNQQSIGNFGIIVSDFANADLAQSIFKTNF